MRGAQGLGTLALLAAALLASGCSIFNSSSAPKPAALEQLAGSAGRVVWNTRIDSIQFPLFIAARGEQFVVAGSDGLVHEGKDDRFDEKK